MSQIMKAFTGLFMVVFMMITATGLLGIFFQELHAQNLHAAMIDEMENSDYDNAVIRECFQVAEEAGYDLEITLYSEHQAITRCQKTEDIPITTEDVSMAKVLVKYPLQLTFFGINLEQEISGYAR